MTPQEWAACLKYLKGFYKLSFKLTAEEMAFWFEELAVYPGEHVITACRHMARTKDGFPALSDVVRYAEGLGDDGPALWAQVIKAVGEVGMYATPTWTDPRVAHGVQVLGGWRAICTSSLSEHAALRAHFFKAIKEYTERARLQESYARQGLTAPHHRPQIAAYEAPAYEGPSRLGDGVVLPAIAERSGNEKVVRLADVTRKLKKEQSEDERD